MLEAGAGMAAFIEVLFYKFKITVVPAKAGT